MEDLRREERVKKVARKSKPKRKGLYANMNKRKKAGTSRTKKKSTVTKKAFAFMKAGFKKKKKRGSKKKK